jgi:hypothetical protein
MKKLRHRVFGGKSGIWLCRKRSAAPSARKSLGWDEERCRPIFSNNTSSTTSSSSHSDQDGRPKVDVLMKSVPSSSVTVSSPLRKRTCRPAFGSKKAVSRIFDTEELFSSYLDISLLSKPTEALPESDGFAINNFTSSSCDGDNGIIESSSTIVSTNDENGPNIEKCVSCSSSTNVRLLTSIISNETNLSEFDFTNDESDKDDTTCSVRQPGATTQLAVARAYFARLDAASPLALEKAAPSPTMIQATARRSRRRLPHTNPALQEEYANYCLACRDANVRTALSIHDFIKHRDSFAAKDRLYDGFLDE